jgi:hypothetical protein
MSIMGSASLLTAGTVLEAYSSPVGLAGNLSGVSDFLVYFGIRLWFLIGFGDPDAGRTDAGSD